MAKVIKLENIKLTSTGEQFVEEYVCGNCRHLINPSDKTCWQCGEQLKQSTVVEHYHKGERLKGDEFLKRRVKIESSPTRGGKLSQ